MKEKNGKLFRRIVNLLLVMALLVTTLPVPAQAASQKSKALAAYRKMLSKSTVTVIPKGTRINYYSSTRYQSTKAKNVKFCLAYIDNDNIPELILKDNEAHFGVWTWRGGKVVCLLHEGYGGAPVGYYKKKGLFYVETYTEGTPFYRNWYKIANGKGKKVLHIFDDYEYSEEMIYYIGGKSTSKYQFNKKLKSYVGSTKITKMKMYKDTAANRKKYIK